jgi:hypothetical protein
MKLLAFLTSELSESDSLARFISRGTVLRICWPGGCLSRKAGLDTESRRILAPLGNRILMALP